MTDYPARLDAARAAVAEIHAVLAAGDLPTHFTDQAEAASAEGAAMFRRLATAEADLVPGRYPRGIECRPEALAAEVNARLLAAMGDGGHWQICPHLQRAMQPGAVRLALRRADCRRCLLPSTQAPPPEEDDRCDVCGARGITTFYPVRMQLGAVLVLGDMCTGCAVDLGHPTAVEAGA